jgi:uncharacterized heparinase superfamily protein
MPRSRWKSITPAIPLPGMWWKPEVSRPSGSKTANAKWQASLHSFRWLRHMRAADTELAAANARSLVTEWMNGTGRRIAGIGVGSGCHRTAHHCLAAAFGDGAAGRRLPLLSRLSEIAGAADSLSAHHGARNARRRGPAARAHRAGFAALSLPVAASTLRGATRNLAAELDRQILPDGGHISRNPSALMELLADLLPLRYTYSNQAEAPPDALIGAVERMLPALRFFRHRDGTPGPVQRHGRDDPRPGRGDPPSR